ncbi:hypothetical protein [Acinetobacter lwoffii]|uniref:hypothetical protein n=1 Tax=Acinetobacter lwoffii TaxID=28090 RepID=UPI003BF6F1C4
MMIVAMAAHTQILLLATLFYFSKIFVGSKGVSAKIAAIVVPSAAFLFLILYFLQDHIVSKLDSYSGIAEDAGVGIIGALKTSIFLILALNSTRQIIPVVAGLPLVLLLTKWDLIGWGCLPLCYM